MKISVRSVSAIAVIAAAEKLPPVGAEFGRRVVADVLRGFPLPPVAVDRRPAMGSQDVGDWKIVRNGEYVRAMYEYAKEEFDVQFDPDDPLWRLQDICLVFDLPRRVRTNRFEQAPVTAALIDGGSDSEVAAYLEAWDERHISGMGK